MTTFAPTLHSQVSKRGFILFIFASTLIIPNLVPYSYGQIGESEFPEGLFTELSGKYVDNNIGIEIEFPSGWSGIGYAGMAIVVPGGIQEMQQMTSVESSAMMVMALPRMEFSNAFSSLATLNEQIEESANEQNCHIETYAYTKINSVDGIHIVAECDVNAEGYSNVNMYGVMSENNFVLIAFAAKTMKDYDENIAAFEQSVSTLEVDHAIPFKTAMSQVLRLTTVNHQVVVKGTKIDIKVQTNSELDNVAFSESEKRISFKVSGQDGTPGIVIIPVDNVLEGPYTVTIDGQATTNFVIADDENTGQESIEINYNHSIHDIVVSGTSVVPEFPMSFLVLVVALGSIVTFLAAKNRGNRFAST